MALILIPLACAVFDGGGIEDPTAATWLKRMEKATRVDQALRGNRYLRFDFVVERGDKGEIKRAHLWDRRLGRYRLDVQGEGRPRLTLFDLETLRGLAYAGYDYRPVRNAKSAIQRAETERQTDAWWLFSIARLRDKGVHVAYDGEWKIEGNLYPTLVVWFDPDARIGADRSRYWYHLDPERDRPFAWSIATKAGRKRVETYAWTRWQRLGKGMLPVRFEQIGGDTTIRIENLKGFDDVRDEVFTQPN